MNTLLIKKESGGALTGIVIIILILIAGGYYFYQITKENTESKKTSNETTTEVTPANKIPASIRSGLDYKLEVSESGVSVVKDLDMGSYTFSEASSVYVQTYEVNKEVGTVNLVFRPTKGAGVMADSIQMTPLVSTDSTFIVPLNQVFTASIGQKIKLKNSTIEIKVIEITGVGCPTGAQC